MTVFVGAMAGALVGASIVETICLPGVVRSPRDATAAGVSAIAAFIGVGLVAALVTRSFDEYNEHVAAGQDPPCPRLRSRPHRRPTSTPTDAALTFGTAPATLPLSDHTRNSRTPSFYNRPPQRSRRLRSAPEHQRHVVAAEPEAVRHRRSDRHLARASFGT